ncbi:glycosyltransferase family 4 protein [Microlunatus endophyticus]|nr:glycosyltransferase family 4 protein [Microlunatus endophyticus]
MIITNDFPPTVGGIEGFVADVCDLLDHDVLVLTRWTSGWRDHDRKLDFPVIRTGRLLLPTPRVADVAAGLLGEYGIRRVIFGAMAPLALLGPRLRTAGAAELLAISHGHESWWATLPGPSALLRRMGDAVDHVSTISDYTRARIAPALSGSARGRMIRIAPPIDTDRFHPAHDHPAEQPIVIAVGRMVAQKGFDVLLRAWALREVHRDAELLLVGDGPDQRRLRRLARRLGLEGSVRFAGRVPREAVPGLLQQATIFALPVRTRLAGLNPEGLGLGFLEAAATGLPVIAGRSGGAPETVIDGSTGYVVDPHDPQALALRIDELLSDPTRAVRMGAAGRDFVRERFGRDVARATLRAALRLDG